MTGPTSTGIHFNGRDGIPGLLFAAIGGFFALDSVLTLWGRSEGEVGAGTFPTILGIILFCFGVILIVRATRLSAEALEIVSPAKIIPILLAPLVFGLTVRGAGLLCSVAGATLVASLAELNLSLAKRATIVAGITALAIAIFVYGVKLPYGLFGPWFGV